MTPACPLALNPFRRRRRPTSQPSAMLPPGTQAMTVRTDDIALCRLGKDLLSILERGSAGAEGERLRRLVAMVEVHLVRGEAPAAVMAWDVSELPQECGRRILAAPDAFELALAVGRVVRSVSGTLIALRPHGSI